MGQVVIYNIVSDKLSNLVSILYQKEYFGFKSSAQQYADKLTNFIYTIPLLPKYLTHNPKHGKYYVRYDVKNKRTSYYITFNIYRDRYLVKNIFTSHESGYATYIKGSK